MNKIDLSGVWDFHLDGEKVGYQLPFTDTIHLPGTTSHSNKGKRNESIEIGFLTDEYKFEGFAWYSKEIELAEDIHRNNAFLFLERTRITKVWLDDVEIGSQNSLNAPHIYDLSNNVTAGKHRITILVDNTNYPTRGGHMTSPDTQTNWNGITGRIELQIYAESYIGEVQIYPNIENKSVMIKAEMVHCAQGILTVSAESFNGTSIHHVPAEDFTVNQNDMRFHYFLGEEAQLWSEYQPVLYRLTLSLKMNDIEVDTKEITFGLREFKTKGDKFTINGKTTFLRGKHDGLLFPLTGHAPTTVEEWLKVLKISKSYGINHYRFHTCCPPEAAFTAADMLGIYMEPELPFWGTVTDEQDKNHNQAEQDYLIQEGFLMLRHFGNHPSFVMMSLGNELWGSKERINQMLRGYKEYDNRHLYTQGSNNFQHVPEILDQEDFFCGVRCSKYRLFRGSYGMCDAPLGHVQVDEPSTMKDYDEVLVPISYDSEETLQDDEGTIQIQYGTEAKTVKASGNSDGIIPQIPVVSHEIGQYETFPNFEEIIKYTGSLKARNLETFQKRLVEKKLDHLAADYFKATGKLAVACYKEELEAAFRSRRMAGFQILDLQDFTGQGTALVGILDAFMDSKGIVSPKEWRSFCSDAVLLARFAKYNYLAGEYFDVHIELTHYRNVTTFRSSLIWELRDEATIYESGELTITVDSEKHYIDLCDLQILLPDVSTMKKLTLFMRIDQTDIEKSYDIWVYPKDMLIHNSMNYSQRVQSAIHEDGLHISDKLTEDEILLLENGQNLILIPKLNTLSNVIDGYYCADFWCYPMFRAISEWMNKDVAVGTMGLLIDNTHPIFRNFPCDEYSTYQWWNIVSNSKSIILDDTAHTFRPIVQTIDNFERNHKLGMLFECKVLNGKLLVCACDFDKIMDKVEGRQFLYSILEYAKSEDFNPQARLDIYQLSDMMI